MATHRLEPTVFYYTFAQHEPAVHVRSGDTIIAETRDAFGMDARMEPLPDLMKEQVVGTTLRESNPVVGPIYVEDADEGDLLAVHIRDIRITRALARSRQSAQFGSLTGEGVGHHLLYNDPIETIWYDWELDLERGIGILLLPDSELKRVTASLDPFIGSIGVAPRFGRVETTLAPGEYGGNLDCVETRPGTTIYFPVWVQGAYLAFGDVHALQGDGELNGTALEVPAEVSLDVAVLKGVQAEWPRLENDEYIMVVGSTRPLMDCVRLAQIELLNCWFRSTVSVGRMLGN
jgi:acetamidase/formamidase